MPGELGGRTVGVVGMGHIGREVARLAKAFGCRVLAIRRSYRERGADPPADEALPPADLDYLLGESDFVVLAAPLSEETAGLIGERELRLLGPHGYLINVARGGLVDEPALVRALRGGAIAGAALDVYEREPLPVESALWGLDNVILTPHIAAGTEHYEERATEISLRQPTPLHGGRAAGAARERPVTARRRRSATAEGGVWRLPPVIGVRGRGGARR